MPSDPPVRRLADVERELAIVQQELKTEWCLTLILPRLRALEAERLMLKALEGPPALRTFQVRS